MNSSSIKRRLLTLLNIGEVVHVTRKRGQIETKTPLFVACLLLVFAATASRAQKPEPSPPGKTLAQWLALLREPPTDPKKPDRDWSLAPMALARIGAPAAPGVAAALRDGSPSTRRRAAVSLLAMGPKGQAGIPDLIQALKDTEASVRKTSAAALASIGTASSEVVTALAAALKDPEAAVREATATSLGRLRAQAAIAALTEATKDTNGAVRQAAERALRRVEGRDEAVPQKGPPSKNAPKATPQTP